MARRRIPRRTWGHHAAGPRPRSASIKHPRQPTPTTTARPGISEPDSSACSGGLRSRSSGLDGRLGLGRGRRRPFNRTSTGDARAHFGTWCRLRENTVPLSRARDSAGIRIVDSDGPAGGPGAEFTSRSVPAVRLRDGRIVAAGWAMADVRVFDSAGRWVTPRRGPWGIRGVRLRLSRPGRQPDHLRAQAQCSGRPRCDRGCSRGVSEAVPTLVRSDRCGYPSRPS